MVLNKIISGGQTGVDQAALQFAINRNIPHGGWCPPGRVCENGIIPLHFNLKETPLERDASEPYIPRSQRTIRNVRDADGMWVLGFGKDINNPDQGTKLAIDTARRLKKPYLIIDLDNPIPVQETRHWLVQHRIKALSVGGPSESTSPGIFDKTNSYLNQLFFVL
ncbi:MAG: putative molybdenum carrier protein [Balneolales bacterium]|nr:putative molybdenum carrier protein [Balneolales bacterium]